ncbi:Nramp family divalent metal transporter [Streptomyces sp. NPDC051976]|uniref:Nramp family divalent metal transporter n=1 Tax=Streptomyces sp. NPDC051976 TaxID=3154947 RepID=UPI003444A845
MAAETIGDRDRERERHRARAGGGGGERGAPRAPRLRFASGLVMVGPAFAAAVAYVDPGNFATDFAAGTDFGPRLLWVVAVANAFGMLVQILAAKLGLATGRNLAELCRERYPAPVVLGLWLVAECVAMATDLAEVIGGAVALQLLFHLPLLVGGVLTTACSFLLLAGEHRNRRRFEAVVAGCLAVVLAGLAVELARAGTGPGGAVAAGLVPHAPGSAALVVAGGIVGATVMPHVVFLHSDLSARHRAELPGTWETKETEQTVETTDTAESPKPALARLRRQVRIDVFVALGIAGLANMAMLVLGTRLSHAGPTAAATLQSIHSALGTDVGKGAALGFAVALLAAGLASTSVGTYAGQVIMAGLTGRTLPLTLRRLITALPALGVLLTGTDPTAALIWSQVILSFGIPFVLVPLISCTRDPSLMGPLVNTRAVSAIAMAVAGVILVQNTWLLATMVQARFR